MTPARCFALAVLIGACCLGSAALAQDGMPGVPGPYSSPEGVSPYRTPMPTDAVPWYGCPDDEAYASPHPCKEKLFDGGFIRAEYLNWNIRDPGDVLLGAPVQGVPFPRD